MQPPFHFVLYTIHLILNWLHKIDMTENNKSECISDMLDLLFSVFKYIMLSFGMCAFNII